MSKEWPRVKFGQIMRPNKRPYTLGDTEDANLVGMRLYGGGPFHRELKPAMQIAKKSHFVIKTGDVIYNKLFAWKGTFGIVPPELDGMFVSDKFPTYELDRSKVDETWLRWYFRCPPLWEEAQSMSIGSAALSKLTLNPPKFMLLTIPLPPLAEQRRVVARIEELASQIQEARTLRHQAAEEAEALLINQVGQMFSRLETKHKSREFGSFSPHVTSGPRNWAKHYEQTGSRFYRAQDVGPAGKVLDDSKVFITPPPGEQGRTAMLQHGDLMLVITGATVGRVNVYRRGLEPGFVSQHVGICRLPQNDVDPEFALWGLRGPSGQAQLLGQRYGQGKPGLNLTNIRALSLPFPPLPEQRRIVAELDALQAKVDALKRLQAETAAELDALLPAILDRAFKGEL